MSLCVHLMKSVELSRAVACGLVLVFGPALHSLAQTSSSDPAKPAVSAYKELSLSAAAEPVPALTYRLIPAAFELNPGDAAPIYLRIRHELRDESFNEISSRETEWMSLPLRNFPTAEARKFVDSWLGRLKQIEFGTRRQYCDWSYTFPEQSSQPLTILLPDAQSMRQWARLIAIKARLETAERQYDEAVQTLKMGLAFGRHVGEGPFLISALVGIAIEGLMLDRVEELIAQPGAPNLYWALTALPNPLMPTKRALELEQAIGENAIPELRQALDAHSKAEWSAVLSRLYPHMRAVLAQLVEYEESTESQKARTKLELDAFRNEVIPLARPWLVGRGYDKRAAEAMSDDEVVVRYVVENFHILRDQIFKASYLPFASSRSFAERTAADVKAAREGPLSVFATLFPMVRTVARSEVRLQRRVALLRTIEAIRLYAASHGGKLPESLEQVKEVPVPNDPVTDQSFGYELKGNTAVITSPAIDGQAETALDYRLTIRP